MLFIAIRQLDIGRYSFGLDFFVHHRKTSKAHFSILINFIDLICRNGYFYKIKTITKWRGSIAVISGTVPERFWSRSGGVLERFWSGSGAVLGRFRSEKMVQEALGSISLSAL